MSTPNETHHRNIYLFLLLSLLAAFPPLSTDMYLPALPLLQDTWQQPMTVINMTLAGFFIGYCISLLLYGPLSDQFGRRPPLLAGIALYIGASVLCAFSGNAILLIIFRILQGVGSASASVIAMAITKDVYQGNERQRILAYMGIIMALAPMLSPIFGGWIMTWLSWHWVFITQAAIGAIAWMGVFRLEEPMQKRSAGSLAKSLGMYGALLNNKKYFGLVLLFSMAALPHFSFIGSAADIYIGRFGLSEQMFGYFFALNAMAIMAGSFACTRLQKLIDARGLLTVSFAGLLTAGTLMFANIISGPWGLTIPMALASFSFGLSRPPSNNMVLEQVERGAGAASSLLIFVYFIVAAFSMWFISLEWQDKVMTIGVLAMTSGGVVLAIWTFLPHFTHLSSRKISVEGTASNQN